MSSRPDAESAPLASGSAPPGDAPVDEGTGPAVLGVASGATDAALARRAGMGDRPAYEELFRRHFSSSYRFALRMLDGDEALADDVVQDTWVKVWQKLPGFQGRSRFTTWLYTIVTRTAHDHRRRSRPLPIDHHLLEPMVSEAGSGIAPSSPEDLDPAKAVVADELWQTLTLALSELPWRQRASWLLREFEGMSYDEIGSVLDCSPTVVRGQLHRARRQLAIRMEQWR